MLSSLPEEDFHRSSQFLLSLSIGVMCLWQHPDSFENTKLSCPGLCAWRVSVIVDRGASGQGSGGHVQSSGLKEAMMGCSWTLGRDPGGTGILVGGEPQQPYPTPTVPPSPQPGSSRGVQPGVARHSCHVCLSPLSYPQHLEWSLANRDWLAGWMNR